MAKQKKYLDIWQAQDACNLLGVMRWYASALQEIMDEAGDLGMGTGERNVWLAEHPVVVLFTSKLMHLGNQVGVMDWKAESKAGDIARLIEADPDRPVCLYCHFPAHDAHEAPGTCAACGKPHKCHIEAPPSAPKEDVYKYRYTDSEGEPLTRCPNCNDDLTRGVEVDTGMALMDVDYLDADGVLQDGSMRVWRGLHRGTYCSNCHELLINFECVQEDNIGQ